MHGDEDKLVPIEQAERFIAKLKETGVPAELIVKKGGDHGGEIIGFALPKMADWFDRYLKQAEK